MKLLSNLISIFFERFISLFLMSTKKKNNNGDGILAVGTQRTSVACTKRAK